MGPSTDGPAEKVEYGPTWPGNPGNIRVAELGQDVDALPLFGDAKLCLGQQRGQCDLLVLVALPRGENGDLRGGILLQR